MDDNDQNLKNRLSSLRIILALMMLGIIAFTAMSQVFPIKADASSEKTMSIVTGIMALAGLSGYFVMRMILLSSARSKLDRDDPESAKDLSLQTYFTIALLGSAMAEGVGILGIVSAMITGQQMLLIVPVAAILAIAPQFPTVNGFARCYQSITGNPLPSSDWPR